ncbi:MAG: hypothetical protein KTR18_02940 [Acidiferrobacterales bacterium]|nr:hypothetical protein [Acidiferrobacterales bacterium]
MNMSSKILTAALAATCLSYGEITAAQCNSHDAIESFINQQFEAANEKFIQCLNAEENIAESNFYLGLIARNAKELDKAEQFFKSATMADPRNEIYQLDLAVTLEWKGELRRALAIYKTLSDNQSLTPAKLGKARMLHWMGQIEQSLEIYREMLKNEPENKAIKTGLGFALISNYELNEAREHFEQILRKESSNVSAMDGLTMLDNVKARKLDLSYGSVQSAGKETLGSLRISYTSAESYRFRWGFEHFIYEQPVITPNLNSIPDNQSIKNSFGLSGSYRINAKSSLYYSGARQSLTGDSTRLKLQLELTLKDTIDNTILAGVIPSYSSGSVENTLGYAGYVFNNSTSYAPMVQLFYNENEKDGTSTALSISLTKSYGKKNYFQLGGSTSRTETSSASSVFANVHHFVSGNTAISAKYLNNFFTNETTFTLGISHEF